MVRDNGVDRIGGVCRINQDGDYNTPAIATIRDSMRRYGKVGNNTVFYEGIIPLWHDKVFADQFNPPGATILNCLSPNDREQWAELQVTPWTSMYWRRVAQALALESSGTVWILAPTNVPDDAEQRKLKFTEDNRPLALDHFGAGVSKNVKVDQLMMVKFNALCEDPKFQSPEVLWKRENSIPNALVIHVLTIVSLNFCMDLNIMSVITMSLIDLVAD